MVLPFISVPPVATVIKPFVKKKKSEYSYTPQSFSSEIQCQCEITPTPLSAHLFGDFLVEYVNQLSESAFHIWCSSEGKVIIDCILSKLYFQQSKCEMTLEAKAGAPHEKPVYLLQYNKLQILQT